METLRQHLFNLTSSLFNFKVQTKMYSITLGELDDIDDNLLLLFTEDPILSFSLGSSAKDNGATALSVYKTSKRRERSRGKRRTAGKDNNVVKVSHFLAKHPSNPSSRMRRPTASHPKRTMKQLRFGHGAPTTQESQSLRVIRFNAFRQHTLKQSLKTPLIGDHLVRFFDAVIRKLGR